VSYEQFAARLAGMLSLGVTVDTVSREISLYDDWCLDSFLAFQLIVAVEAMAGVVEPPAMPPELFTVADAHRYYLDLRAGVAHLG